MTQSDFKDTFSNAKAYEDYVGRWSRLVASEFIDWLDAAPQLDWLDLGAGTGILSQAILQKSSPKKVVGIDLSEDYIAFARQQIKDERLEFRIGDAVNIPFEAPQFDMAVAGLVLNFLPSPQQALKNMSDAIRSGGTVAAYVWDYAGRMEMMRHFWDAAIVVDPAASAMDAGQAFTICEPDNLRALFESGGLKAVEVIPIDIQTQFKNFDDYWLPFLGAQGSVSKYLGGLNDEIRNTLRKQLQEQLPTTEAGEIHLVARAWAVKGTKAI